MAIFKRSARDTTSQPADDVDVDAVSGADADGAARTAEQTPVETVPHVGISMSTFGAPAPSATPQQPQRSVTRPPAEAPARTETVPGMPDNTLVQAALASLPEKPGNVDVMNVMRQSMQGTMYVRVRGDARALTAEGKPITLAVSQIDGARFLLAFTGGASLRASVEADGDRDTSALGLPVANVFRNAIEGPYEGLVIDHAIAGSRIVLPVQLISKAFEEGDPAFTIKNLLAGPRSAETAAAVGEALAAAPLWVAAGPAGDSGQLGLAESRTASGERRLEVYSHPLEVLVLERGDRPVPVTAPQLARAIASNPALSGVIVDPGGPWIHVDRADLGPVLARADETDESAAAVDGAAAPAAAESADSEPAAPAATDEPPAS
ncbi:SseB family protein [Microbacterium sp. cf332]|uniref:SseB family protein n=1 Tax=Microbacterium sp. cf332 TaxID=1761804 RepID=UPI00088A7E7D|nr:SseB family protein [Microbacterium sp. cf332]SDQ75920.1 SseB protein N-terminal domain-containing protein [Microbacterium sp. cf332]